MTRRALERRFLRFRRTGDPAALAAVFDATAPQVLRVAMHLVRDPATAEDLLQRTFVTAIESAASFDVSRPLLPWLVGVLSNHAREAARKAARVVDAERLPRRESLSPPEAAAAAEALSAAGDALDGLDEPARSILVLRFRHGLEPAEIADALGIPPATVRSHLHRGTKRLKERVPRGLALPAVFLGPPPRGLADVRRVVLARARDASRALAAAGAASVAVPLGLGVLVVNKTAIAVAAAVLLFGGAGTWVGLGLATGRDSPGSAPAFAAPPPAAPTLARAPESAAGPATAAEGGPGSVAAKTTRFLVLDPDGRPVPRMTLVVVLGRVEETAVLRTTTGADGLATVADLPPRRYGVWLGNGRGEYVTVPSKDGGDVVIRTTRGVTVEGEVVGPSGAPVSGAEVWIDPSSRWLMMARAATTDARGRFRIEDAELAAYVGARVPGLAPSGARRLLGAAGQTERIRLVLGAGAGRLDGRLVDGEGRPVAGGTVLVGPAFATPMDLPDGTRGAPPLPFLLTSDANGAFAAEGVGAGAQPVLVRARGFADWQGRLEVSPLPRITEWRVELQPPVVLEGVVCDASGRPVPDAYVATSPRTSLAHLRIVRADTEGRYRIEDLPANESLTFLASADDAEGASLGNAPIHVPPSAPGTVVRREVTLSTPAAAHVAVRVLSESGEPLDGFRVGARTPSELTSPHPEWTSDDGRATLNVRPSETYLVEVLDPAGDEWTPCAVVPGVRPGGTELEIRVRDDARPRSRIVAAVMGEGPLPVGTRVSAMPVQGPAGVNLALDVETGRWTSRPVPAGTYEVSVSAPGYGTVPFGRRRVGVGETADWGTLRLRPPGSLLVRLTGADGLAERAYSLSADAGAGATWARIEPTGEARFMAMAPGRYRVTLEPLEMGAATAVWATVESGVEGTLDLTVGPGHLRTVRIDATREDLSGLTLVVHSAEPGSALRLSRVWRDPRMEASSPLWLAPGRYVAEAETSGGQRASVAFDVRGDGEDPVVLRLAK